MAIVYDDEGKVATAPTVGDEFWWFMTPRRLLKLRVVGTKPDEIKLYWWHYLGLYPSDSPMEGEISWTAQEWESAHLRRFKQPLAGSDLSSDEELCRSCHGSYFETERDLEIMGCIWCGGAGKTTKAPPAPPPPTTRRSPFHPAVQR
jgi:hypothetical protein